ncbi:hypothetical protein FEM48_Zijuj06G0003500 [Ziziphus jujuba var. spinosa]|uniref:SWI/SNF complex subunit SWI3B n=1 Tax=Ziziphus jujuba var. spinosa TaxID=714518 RepID=A0A978V634_ZIZJJ|nr:hypothetical protein FEM48_Zijuj06G0003500 [Ziziphus jujuba var. spinosa]
MVMEEEKSQKSMSPGKQSQPVKPETAASDSQDAVAAKPSPALNAPSSRPSSDADVAAHLPSYSSMYIYIYMSIFIVSPPQKHKIDTGWFSWDKIHECEVRLVPEFFESRSAWKSPRVYMYYRNSIIKQYRDQPSRKITFTEVRKSLVGDVGSIRRVFDFLEAWGLINYSPSALQNKLLKWDDKDSKPSSSDPPAPPPPPPPTSKDDVSKRNCNHCKSLCSIACFVCDKYDMTLCARCYVRGNYQVGVSSSDFRRVEINEDSKSDWLDKDTLHLLEALLHHGDDWRKVAQHVGRSEKDCVSHFIKLPFGEEFVDRECFQSMDPRHADCGPDTPATTSSSTKRMRLTPLADASNPIMAQAAFLSALAGVEVAENAACAAVTMLSQVDYRSSGGARGPQDTNTRWNSMYLGTIMYFHKELLLDHPTVHDTGLPSDAEVDAASNGNTNLNTAAEGAWLDANSQLEKEELDVERAISGITEVQMKEIQDKIVHFEALDLQMEKEWRQLEQMKNMLFVDQLTFLFHKSSAQKTG